MVALMVASLEIAAMAFDPPVIQGRRAFRDFAHSVQFDYRYFRSGNVERFLDEVRTTCAVRKVTVSPDMRYWRARLGSRLTDDDRIRGQRSTVMIWGSVDRPYPPEKMKPLPVNWKSEGRANPRGISYLYLATNRNTAIAEVRPWIGSLVTVAEFRVVRDLTLIDCSKYHAGILGLTSPASSATREEGLWSAIDEAFAKPVGRDDDVKEYIPTQILSELFRSKGYDGIEYKSLLDDEGCNLALFDPSTADVRSCRLVKVSLVQFECGDVDTGEMPDSSGRAPSTSG